MATGDADAMVLTEPLEAREVLTTPDHDRAMP